MEESELLEHQIARQHGDLKQCEKIVVLGIVGFTVILHRDFGGVDEQ